jgi:hypothetical protein
LGYFLRPSFIEIRKGIDDHVQLSNRISEPNRSRSDATQARNREIHKHGFVHTLLTESGPTAEELIKKRWAVIVTDKPAFATSDNPVMVLHDEFLRW